MKGIIGGVIGAIAKPVDTWIKNKGEKAMAKHKLDLAELENKARLMLSTSEHNASWEMASLTRSSIGLKWASFSLFSIPIILTVVAPLFGQSEVATQIWTNLE